MYFNYRWTWLWIMWQKKFTELLLKNNSISLHLIEWLMVAIFARAKRCIIYNPSSVSQSDIPIIVKRDICMFNTWWYDAHDNLGVYCVMTIVQDKRCTTSTVQRVLYITHCTAHLAQHTLHSTRCTTRAVQYTMSSTPGTAHTAQHSTARNIRCARVSIPQRRQLLTGRSPSIHITLCPLPLNYIVFLHLSPLYISPPPPLLSSHKHVTQLCSALIHVTLQTWCWCFAIFHQNVSYYVHTSIPLSITHTNTTKLHLHSNTTTHHKYHKISPTPQHITKYHQLH